MKGQKYNNRLIHFNEINQYFYNDSNIYLDLDKNPVFSKTEYKGPQEDLNYNIKPTSIIGTVDVYKQELKNHYHEKKNNKKLSNEKEKLNENLIKQSVDKLNVQHEILNFTFSSGEINNIETFKINDIEKYVKNNKNEIQNQLFNSGENKNSCLNVDNIKKFDATENEEKSFSFKNKENETFNFQESLLDSNIKNNTDLIKRNNKQAYNSKLKNDIFRPVSSISNNNKSSVSKELGLKPVQTIFKIIEKNENKNKIETDYILNKEVNKSKNYNNNNRDKLINYNASKIDGIYYKKINDKIDLNERIHNDISEKISKSIDKNKEKLMLNTASNDNIIKKQVTSIVEDGKLAYNKYGEHYWMLFLREKERDYKKLKCKSENFNHEKKNKTIDFINKQKIDEVYLNKEYNSNLNDLDIGQKEFDRLFFGNKHNERILKQSYSNQKYKLSNNCSIYDNSKNKEYREMEKQKVKLENVSFDNMDISKDDSSNIVSKALKTKKDNKVVGENISVIKPINSTIYKPNIKKKKNIFLNPRCTQSAISGLLNKEEITKSKPNIKYCKIFEDKLESVFLKDDIYNKKEIVIPNIINGNTSEYNKKFIKKYMHNDYFKEKIEENNIKIRCENEDNLEIKANNLLKLEKNDVKMRCKSSKNPIFKYYRSIDKNPEDKYKFEEVFKEDYKN